MQLRAISYQLGKGREEETFSSVYETFFAGQGNESFQKAVFNMTTLLRYLEENIDAPPHWICNSHNRCVFYSNDHLNYEHYAQNRKVIVSASSLKNYYSLEIPTYWESHYCVARIESGNMESTAKLIDEILHGKLTFAVTKN